MSDQNAPVVQVDVEAPEAETPAVQIEAPVAHDEHVEVPEEQPRARNWNWIPWIIAILAIIGLVLALVFGGNRSNTVTQPTQPASEQPLATQPAPATGSISEATVLDLGSIGSYHAVYDTIQNKWTLGIWETSAVRKGTELSEFKLKATSVTFVMPSDGIINNSAGHIAINGTEWVLGNPAKDQSGNSLVAKGSTVTIWTDGPNDSAGFQIWFK